MNTKYILEKLAMKFTFDNKLIQAIPGVLEKRLDEANRLTQVIKSGKATSKEIARANKLSNTDKQLENVLTRVGHDNAEGAVNRFYSSRPNIPNEQIVEHALRRDNAIGYIGAEKLKNKMYDTFFARLGKNDSSAMKDRLSRAARQGRPSGNSELIPHELNSLIDSYSNRGKQKFIDMLNKG